MIRYETFINKRVRPGPPSNQEVNRDESISLGAGDKRVTQGQVATQHFKSLGKEAESLGNVRKINHLIGFSAN